MKNYCGGAPKNKPHDTAKADAGKNTNNNEFPKEDSVDGRFPSTKNTCYTLVLALNYN
jgi:hypothetical protein